MIMCYHRLDHRPTSPLKLLNACKNQKVLFLVVMGPWLKVSGGIKERRDKTKANLQKYLQKQVSLKNHEWAMNTIKTHTHIRNILFFLSFPNFFFYSLPLHLLFFFNSLFFFFFEREIELIHFSPITFTFSFYIPLNCSFKIPKVLTKNISINAGYQRKIIMSHKAQNGQLRENYQCKTSEGHKNTS